MVSFEEIMEGVYRLDYAKFDNAPIHFFSRRHRKAMKKILYPKSERTMTASRDNFRKIPLKRRVFLALMVIILAMVSITAGAAVIRGFTRKEHCDNTQLFAVNAEIAPKTIEYVYYLPVIPEGYVLHEQLSDTRGVLTRYIDPATNRMMVFYQDVKEGFSRHFDNEHLSFEELEINSKYALYHGDEDGGAIIWDNEDYVLQIFGCFSKEELINLAKSIEREA